MPENCVVIENVGNGFRITEYRNGCKPNIIHTQPNWKSFKYEIELIYKLAHIFKDMDKKYVPKENYPY